MKKRILQIFIIIFAIIFIFSSIQMIRIHLELSAKQDEFDSLVSLVDKQSDYQVNIQSSELILNKYQKLYELNNDLVGWIKLDGTILNYPVVHTPSDPEYYLRRGFNKERSIPGVPFVGGDSSIDSSNIIIYGHNMDNGTMFAPLYSYKDKSFWEKNKIIKFDSLYSENEYEVIAAFFARAYRQDEENVFRYYNYNDLKSEEEFNEYYRQVKQSAIYDTGIDAKYGDQLLTLSTCEYSVENGRFVVVAKRINN